jgi:hypothetical protein
VSAASRKNYHCSICCFSFSSRYCSVAIICALDGVSKRQSSFETRTDVRVSILNPAALVIDFSSRAPKLFPHLQFTLFCLLSKSIAIGYQLKLRSLPEINIKICIWIWLGDSQRGALTRSKLAKSDRQFDSQINYVCSLLCICSLLKC